MEAVGADRAAAEWILRLGGSVKFKDFEHKNSDYNHLPSGTLANNNNYLNFFNLFLRCVTFGIH